MGMASWCWSGSKARVDRGGLNVRLRFFGPLPASESGRALAETMGGARAELAEVDDAMERRFTVGGAYRRAARAARSVVEPGAADPDIVFHDPTTR